MAGLAQMAARARIQASFARQGNLADCARAGQTQAKLMGLLGTGAGATLSWIVGANPFNVFITMIPLAVISTYSVYRSSVYIVLQSMNVQRTERIFADLMPQLSAQRSLETFDDKGMFRALTPQNVAEVETFCLGEPEPLFARKLVLQPMIGAVSSGISGWPSKFLRGWVELDVVLPLLRSSEEDAWRAAWHADKMYAIALPAARVIDDLALPVIVWHHFGASPNSRLQAFWHACVLRHFLAEDTHTCVESLDALALKSWPSVLAALKNEGWHVERVFLDGFGGSLNDTTE